MSNISVVNTFERGMAQDPLESLQPKGTTRYVLNGVLSSRDSKGFGLSNEEANELIAEVGGEIVGSHYIESMNATALFIVGDIIALFDHTTSEVIDVAAASEFGCDWGFNECEWITAIHKTIEPCSEVNLYWSVNCTYYSINLAEMLNEKRKAALIESFQNKKQGNCEFNCDYFKLMKCVCTPKVVGVTKEVGGHGIHGGYIEVAVQLEDYAGNTTNWSPFSKPVYIPTENNMPGELSNSAVEIHITDLDCRYNVANIAVRRVANGVHTVELVESRNYNTNGLTFLYSGQRGRTLDLGEILIKRKTYIRGREIAQKDGRAWLYGIRQEKNPDMQRRVNEATLLFMLSAVPPRISEKNNVLSLQRGENYMFGVVYNYCDGTHSHVFPLIPKGGCGSESPGIFGAPVAPLMQTTISDYERVKRKYGKQFIGQEESSCCGTNGITTMSPGVDADDTVEFPGNNKRSLTPELDAWQTDLSNWENAAKCDDCSEPWCCEEADGGTILIKDETGSNCEGCMEDELFIANDGPKLQTAIEEHNDMMSSYGEDKMRNQIDYGKSSEIKDSSANLLRDAVDNQAVDITVGKKRGVSFGGGGGGNNESILARAVSVSNTTPWGDRYHDGRGDIVMEQAPFSPRLIQPGVACTESLYPESTNCHGEKIYGGFAGTPVRLFRTPTEDKCPLFGTDGKAKHVPSKTTPAEDPIYDKIPMQLGIEVRGIPLPENDEEEAQWFPKPLCKNSPYTIVMVERDYINSTVQANGLFTSMFAGNVGDKAHAIPRHGLCSRELVDRHIYEDDGSTLGSREGFTGGGSERMYNFHGLDTNVGRVGLSGTRVRVSALFTGTGERYGLYAKGREPDDRLNGQRVDQRGARQYINLYSRDTNPANVNIAGLSYLEADSVLSGGQGLPLPVCNLSRESSVVVGLSGSLPGPQEDRSFIMDGYNHEATIKNAHGWYGSIVRDIPNQYGSIPGMKFIDSGIQAVGWNGNVRGFTGDVFIGPYTIRRTGFVSNKIGTDYEMSNAGLLCPGVRDKKTICESAHTTIVEDFGLDHFTTNVPRDGDGCDPRNWANGYRGEGFAPLTWEDAANGSRVSDIYYPKLQKTLVTFMVESRVNPWKRATGQVDQKSLGRYFYPKLHGDYLDSDGISRHPWEESYLNRFYYEVLQPSRAQLLKKFFYKSLLNIILPSLVGTLGFTSAENPATLVGFGVFGPALLAYWEFMKDLIMRDDYLDNMIGLPACRTDIRGGENINNIVNFEDNWHDYNFDYSEVGRTNIYQPMPLNYNTCECDDCEENKETTNEIFYSNKQIIGNQIDSYRIFHAFSYLDIPAEAGKLTRLNNFAGNFYAHTTDGLFIIKYNAVTAQVSQGIALLGGNEMVVEPVRYMEGLSQGHAGLKDPNSLINTPFGTIWPDQESGEIFLFTGGGSPMSVNGYMDNFFKEHLPFCDKGECHDERSSTYYLIGYDPRYRRVLITKVDGDDKYTISFVPGGEDQPAVWISFHSYTPKDYFWDRYNLFSVESGGKIYKHNIKDKYQEFSGQTYPFIVDFTTVLDGREWFMYMGTEIHTQASSGDTRGLDETFDRVSLRNFSQGTGTMLLKMLGDNPGTNEKMTEHIREDGTIPMSVVRRKFFFHKVFDNTKEGCGNKPTLIWDDCKHTWEINESIYDCAPPNKQMFKQRNLQDEFLNYRFTYSGGNNKTNLKLISVKTTMNRNEK
jgi:hypothetical protein